MIMMNVHAYFDISVCPYMFDKPKTSSFLFDSSWGGLLICMLRYGMPGRRWIDWRYAAHQISYYAIMDPILLWGWVAFGRSGSFDYDMSEHSYLR